jgi:hypothetical protein
MKSLNVLNQKFAVGDTVDMTREQLDRLIDEGKYDSYDQSYEFSGFKWKVAHRIANADGSTTYTLVAGST